MLRIFTVLFLSFFCLLQSVSSLAQTPIVPQDELLKSFMDDPNAVISENIIDAHKFYGLAGYYNSAYVKHISNGKMHNIHEQSITLGPKDWLAVVGRFNVLIIQADDLSVTVDKEQKINLNNSANIIGNKTHLEIISKPNLKALSPELNQIRYSHLILPIKLLARSLETVLLALYNVIGNWGLVIIVISALLKALTFPLGRVVKKYQTQVSQTQSKLAPRLAQIKTTLKGEQAHKAFIQAHKDIGVTTFYTMKPMIGLLVQVPIWIAIFNVLAEMPQISGHGFLWINDLAYPDALFNWGAALPLLGDTLNLMPILMTVVTVISTLYFRDDHAPMDILKKQKRNLFFMAAAFLILFYPFPAGMVLYWTFANILNFVQQLLEKR